MNSKTIFTVPIKEVIQKLGFSMLMQERFEKAWYNTNTNEFELTFKDGYGEAKKEETKSCPGCGKQFLPNDLVGKFDYCKSCYNKPFNLHKPL